MHTLLSKKKNISASRASKLYQVPIQTLRDRVLGKIDINTVTTGRALVLSLEEEAKLMSHLKEVAKLGYGYTRQEVVDIASDYAYTCREATISFVLHNVLPYMFAPLLHRIRHVLHEVITSCRS